MMRAAANPVNGAQRDSDVTTIKEKKPGSKEPGLRYWPR